MITLDVRSLIIKYIFFTVVNSSVCTVVYATARQRLNAPI